MYAEPDQFLHVSHVSIACFSVFCKESLDSDNTSDLL